MSSIVDNTIFTPNPFASSILGDDNVFDTYLLDKRVGTGVLDQYGGASAAYSLYDLGNKRGTVVETGETVYGDFVTYESDFSAGTNGWSAVNGTIAGNIDGIGGLDDNLRFTAPSGSTLLPRITYGSRSVGNAYRYEFDVFIPSSNSHYNSLQTRGIVGAQVFTPSQDEWVSISDGGVASDTIHQIVFGDDGNFLPNDPAGDDVIYIRNVRITELDTYRTLDVAYHNPAVRLRRDSDNTHKSFPGGAFTQMLNWANEDVVQDLSTFDSDVDGWSDAGTSTSIQSNGKLQVTYGGSAGGPNKTGVTFEAGQRIKATWKCRKVSGSGDIQFRNNFSSGYWNFVSGNPLFTPTDTEVSYEVIFDVLNKNGSPYFTDSGTGVFEFDDIQFEVITSNAYAATWYDQSGVSVTSTPATDDASSDGTSSWATADSTLAFDTDHYNWTYTTASQWAVLPGTPGISEGDIIRFSVEIKDGTLSGVDVGIGYSNDTATDNAIDLVARQSTTSSWARYSGIITATSFASGRPNISLYALMGGAGNIQFRNFRIEVLDKAHNDAIQSTADSQPKVVDAGVLVTDANGNYALDFDGVDDYFNLSSAITYTDEFCNYHVLETDTLSFSSLWCSSSAAAPRTRFTSGTNVNIVSNTGSTLDSTIATIAIGSVHILAISRNASDVAVATLDASAGTTGSVTGNFTADQLYVRQTSTQPFNGRVAATLMYPVDRNAGVEQILSNTIKTALS